MMAFQYMTPVCKTFIRRLKHDICIFFFFLIYCKFEVAPVFVSEKMFVEKKSFQENILCFLVSNNISEIYTVSTINFEKITLYLRYGTTMTKLLTINPIMIIIYVIESGQIHYL